MNAPLEPQTQYRLHPASMLVIAVAALAVIAVVATSAIRSSAPRTDVDITLSDFTFEPSSVVIPAGKPVTLRFANEDTVAHDVSFGRDVVTTGNRPSAFAEDLLADVPLRVDPPGALLSRAGEHTLVTVPPGERITLRFELPTDRVGTWELGCFQTGGCHYEAGLHASLEVR